MLATVIKKSGEIRTRGGLKMYKATVADDSGEMELTFFNTKYAVESLDYDAAYLFYGGWRATSYAGEMRAPQIFPPRADRPFFAVYPLTAGVSARTFSGLVEQALKLSPILPERIPADIRAEYRLEEISGAVRAIHRRKIPTRSKQPSGGSSLRSSSRWPPGSACCAPAPARPPRSRWNPIRCSPSTTRCPLR